jgi:translin
MTPDELERSLDRATSAIIRRFDALSVARDHAVTHGRQVIRHAANAVRALHRADQDEADSLLLQARTLLDDIRETAKPSPSVYWAGYVQDAMKEYAEAEITAAILRGTSLPTPDSLGIEDAPWLNALAEAASELRRDTLDALRSNDMQRAESLMTSMDAIYGSLVTVDFPDAVTGGLRRTTDQLRAVLERTRGDVTVAVRQDRLERALQAVEPRDPGDHGGSPLR